jgi:hypothetical protein
MSGEADLHDLWEAHPSSMARYGHSFEKILPYTRAGVRIGSFIGHRGGSPEVVVLYGPTETGKTRYFFDNCHPELWWEVPITTDGTLRFDGLSPLTEDCLFDDFKGEVPLLQFLRLLDRYSRRVNVKYGTSNWRPKRIFITTNYHPMHWYDFQSRKPSARAMFRRLGKFIFCPRPGVARVVFDIADLPFCDEDICRFGGCDHSLLTSPAAPRPVGGGALAPRR